LQFVNKKEGIVRLYATSGSDQVVPSEQGKKLVKLLGSIAGLNGGNSAEFFSKQKQKAFKGVMLYPLGSSLIIYSPDIDTLVSVDPASIALEGKKHIIAFFFKTLHRISSCLTSRSIGWVLTWKWSCW
jgi:hypothetical protein